MGKIVHFINDNTKDTIDFLKHMEDIVRENNVDNFLCAFKINEQGEVHIGFRGLDYLDAMLLSSHINSEIIRREITRELQ